MEYLYYDSQHKEIRALLDSLIQQVDALTGSDRQKANGQAELRDAFIQDAGRLNRAVEELLSTFVDAPSIPATASSAAENQPLSPREAWASTQQLEAILNNLIAGVVVYDSEGVVKFANGYAIALFGFDPTRMQRDTLTRKLQAYGEDGKRVLVSQMPSSTAARGEVVMNRPLTIHSPLGRAAHVLCSAMPVSAGGRLSGVVSVWNDVTGQHNLLKENEHQRGLLEAIFNAITDSVLVFDAQGRPIRANQAAIRFMGFDPVGGDRDDILRNLTVRHPDGRQVKIEEMASSLVLSGKNVRDMTYQIHSIQNQSRTILTSGAPLRSEQGEITGAVTIWHDVTELEQARSQVEAERDRLRAILRSMNDEVWYCDLDENITLMNDAAVHGLGAAGQEDFNGPLMELVTDRLKIFNLDGTPRSTEDTPLLRSLNGETVRGEEIILNVRTGERGFREYIASPIRSKEDEITGAVAVVRDITPQKQQEEALRAAVSRERARLGELNAVLDAVPAIIFITHDPDSREVTGNRVAHEFLRVRPEGNLSKSAPEEEAPRNFQVFQNGRELPPEELPLQVAAATGKPVREFEEDVVFDDSTQAHLIGNASPLLDEAGQPAGAVAAFLDISERVEQNTQMEVQRRLLEHREMERQKIARDLHDGPVQALGGLGFNLQILRDLSVDPDVKRMIGQMQEEVKQQANDLREVINELRPPALARFGLRKAIRSYVEDFIARNPGVEVNLELAEDDIALPDSAVLALYRIFQESLHNIAHHAQASQVSVRLSIHTQDIALEIEDNGIGFQPPSDWVELARQGHFGLVGMKERSEAMGGRFAIQSQPGSGTKLSVRVPWV